MDLGELEIASGTIVFLALININNTDALATPLRRHVFFG